MNEVKLEFNQKDFESIVNEMVPAYQQDKVLDAIQSEEEEISYFDDIGLLLTGEKNDSGLITVSAPNKSTESIWQAIKDEIYNFFCTNSEEYVDERKEGFSTIKQIITIIATAIASTYHLAVGVVTGAVTVGVLSVLKISKNAWCKLNKPE